LNSVTVFNPIKKLRKHVDSRTVNAADSRAHDRSHHTVRKGRVY